MDMQKLFSHLFATDAASLGRRFFRLTFFFLAIGGLLAMVMRWQLAWPALKPETYTSLFSLHGSVMVFYVAIPMLTCAFGYALIPRLINASNTAFPRLGAASFWLLACGGAILLASPFLQGGGAQSGWTAYPPLASLRLNENFDAQSAWYVSLFIFSISALLSALNFAVTIVTSRHAMRMLEMPMTVWSQLITALITLLATPVLMAALLMAFLDHQTITVGSSAYRFTSFFLPDHWAPQSRFSGAAGAGEPILWQHLFWFYAHPAVYIMILPAMGMVSDILAFYASKRLSGYRTIIVCMSAIAVLGFVVWAHHMFQSGMNPTLGTLFSISTMLIAVPSAVEVFNWLATLWGGRIRLTVPMLHALAFVGLFVIGGMSGIFLASPPVNIQLHDTYFVVAHIHYVLFGGTLFGIFAGLTHWFTPITGRVLGKRLGQLHFWLTFVFFNCTFFGMHALGLSGFPRRVAEYANYESFAHFRGLNVFITISALVLGATQLILVANFLWSYWFGPRASDSSSFPAKVAPLPSR